MGLIEHILIGLAHLALVAADILFLMLILQIVHDRWQLAWLEPIFIATKPVMSVVLNYFASLVLNVTGKSCPERTLSVLLIICLAVMRFLIIGDGI